MMSNLSALGLNIDHPYPCQGAELQVTTLQSIKGKNPINQGDRENRKCPYGTYGRRTFAYDAPRLWNALSLQIRTEESLDSFKKAVKTLLFQDTDGFKAKAYMYH